MLPNVERKQYGDIFPERNDAGDFDRRFDELHVDHRQRARRRIVDQGYFFIAIFIFFRERSKRGSTSSSSSPALAFLDPPPAGPGKTRSNFSKNSARLKSSKKTGESSNATYFVSEKGKAMNGLPCHPRIGAMLLFASQRGAASTRLACQLAAGVDSDKSLLRGRDAPLDARSYARAIQGRDVIIADIGSSSSSMNSDDDNSDDEYRKKLGKKVGERGIDVIRVPVDAKLPSSSKR